MPTRWKKLVMNYEEADMATGDYLMALVHKSAVTRDQQARDKARQTFRAIRLLCANAFAKNPYGRGWLPKPYGGIADVGEVFECSVDQYNKIALALDFYGRELAGPKEKQEAEDILVAFADWWVDRGYTANYFGNCCWWWKTEYPHAVSFFLYILALAQHITGRRKYGREFRAMLKFRQGLCNVERTEANAANLTIEALARLYVLKPGHRKLFLRAMKKCWSYSRKAVAGEGFVTGENLRDAHGRPVRINTGPRVACSGVTVAAFLPRQREAILGFTRALLMKYNRKEMFHHLHPSSGRLPRSFAFEHDVLSGHHYTAWLHAYWKSRHFFGNASP
jgi:hypothetical protein